MNAIVSRLGLALVFGLAFGAKPSPAVEPAQGDPFGAMPTLAFDYYEVSGRTAAELRASLDLRRRSDPETGDAYDAYTSWAIDWHIPGSPKGPCRLDLAEVAIKVTVGLPRLADGTRLPAELLQQWQRYVSGLKMHEAKHARSAFEGRKEMLRAIRQADCATADDAAWAAMDRVSLRAEVYDHWTWHGQAGGVDFP